MLCPEVLYFPSPDHHIQVESGNLNDAKSELFIKKKLNNHYFNQLISIVLPKSQNGSQELSEILKDSDSYLIKSVPLSVFINRTFIEGFIKRGNFYALSQNTNIDTDDCFAITPCGKLYLSVNKETFQTLGIEGKISKFSKKNHERYLIQIDLKNPTLLTGKNNFENLKKSLSKDILTKFNIYMTWTTPNTDICPSSIAKHFADSGYDINLVRTNIKKVIKEKLLIPKFNIEEINNKKNSKDKKKNELTEFVDQFIEFIGIITLSCNIEKDEYLNSYQLENFETQLVQNLNITHWKGLFTCKHIEDLFIELSNYIEINPSVPWVSMYVHGFPHSPVSFGLKEHTFFSDGNNSYILILTNTKQYLWYQVLESNKLRK